MKVYRDHSDVKLHRGPGQVGALQHHVTKRVDRIRERQHVGGPLQSGGLARDGEDDPRQQHLRHDHQRDELHRLELGAREHAQKDAEVHRHDRHQRFDAEDQKHVAVVVHLQHGQAERQDLRGLHQREDREPDHVAEHDLASAQGTCHQPLERAL